LTVEELEDRTVPALAWSQGLANFTWAPHPAPQLAVVSDRTDAEGSSVSIQLSASDSDGDPHVFAATNLPPGETLNSSTGLISGLINYGDAAQFGGTYRVTVLAADGHGGVASQSFLWTITPTLRPPVLTSPGDQTNTAGDTVSLQINANDPDGAAITYFSDGLPPGIILDSATGLISGTIDALPGWFATQLFLMPPGGGGVVVAQARVPALNEAQDAGGLHVRIKGPAVVAGGSQPRFWIEFPATDKNNVDTKDAGCNVSPVSTYRPVFWADSGAGGIYPEGDRTKFKGYKAWIRFGNTAATKLQVTLTGLIYKGKPVKVDPFTVIIVKVDVKTADFASYRQTDESQLIQRVVTNPAVLPGGTYVYLTTRPPARYNRKNLENKDK
jgi:hypothetical protein